MDDAARALIAATDALHERASWSEAEFVALRAHFSDDQIQEIIKLCGFYRMVSCFANGLALPLELGAARLAHV